MHKRIMSTLVVLPLVLVLAACASIQLPWEQTTSSSAQSQTDPTANISNQPVENKLALGTLNLEDTDKAVTADQAKTLLLLWKAVKSLSSSENTSAAEMTAIYQQIQEAMSTEQVQAIKDLNLSQTEMQALMQKYGVQLPQSGPANPSAGTATTPGANRSSNGANVGGVPGGGPPPDGSGLDFAPGGMGGNSATTTQKTPAAGHNFSGSLNDMLVDPLIKLLEQRVTA